MVDEKSIFKLYSKLDKYHEKLIDKERYWMRCKPCKNNGQCCKNSDTIIFTSEKTIITNYIKELPVHIRKTLKENVDNGVRCPFRTELSCLIHDVRPLTCRLTPYLANLGKNKIYYTLTSEDCKKMASMEQDIIGSEAISHFKGRVFVDLVINPIGMTRPYLNGDYLTMKDMTYQKLCKESNATAMEFLKKGYDLLN